MQDFLIHLFVKDYENIETESVRYAYGLLSSCVGICLNVLLFGLKFTIGLMSGSISIVSDGFNNLSDCFSCVVVLIGYRLARKPADAKHPFGHGRYEYLVSLLVTLSIFFVGFELFVSSFKRLFEVKEVSYSTWMLVVLGVSCLLKLWLATFNKKIGTKLNHMGILASGQDAMNDVFVTLVAMVSMVLAKAMPTIPFDGIGGIVVSVLIFVSAFELLKEIVTKILGSRVSKELTSSIRKILLSDENVVGIHDLIVHDYGPGVKIGSCHVEVDADMELRKAHDVVDGLERLLEQELHVFMTLHLDPIELHDPLTLAYEKRVRDVLGLLDGVSMHDFRLVNTSSHLNLVFDVEVGFDSHFTNEEIRDRIEAEFLQDEKRVELVITFDPRFEE